MPDDTQPITDAKTRVITMSRRAPIRIRDAEWPILAEVSWSAEEGQDAGGWLKVRRHADGRVVVYGGDSSHRRFPDDLRAGELVAAGADVVAAIMLIAAELGAPHSITRSAIAQLPPEEV